MNMKKNTSLIKLAALLTAMLLLTSCADSSATENTTSKIPVQSPLWADPIVKEEVSVFSTGNDTPTEFILSAREHTMRFHGIQSPGTECRIDTKDLTGDGYPEIVVIFVSHIETGIHEEDIHIFDGQTLEEYPIEEIDKTLPEHIEFYTDEHAFYIAISDQMYPIDKSALATEKDYLFDWICTGLNYHYALSDDGTLHYITYCSVGMVETYGSIDATLKLVNGTFVYSSSQYLPPKQP